MHRTFARNLDQLVGHRWIDPALHADHTPEAIDLAGPALGRLAAILAVLGRQLAMFHADGKTPERELLVLGVEAQRHRRACAQSCRQIVVGAGPAVEAAGRSWLVCQKAMTARSN